MSQADYTACVRVQKPATQNSSICWKPGMRVRSPERRVGEAEATEERSGQIMLLKEFTCLIIWIRGRQKSIKQKIL